MRRPGARRLEAVHAPAARRGGDRRLGQDELLAQPAAHLREREAARFPAWMTQLALSLPKLELLRTEVRALGPDSWRVRVAVVNSGWLPAYVSQRRARSAGGARRGLRDHAAPRAILTIALVSGKGAHGNPQLEGHAPKQSQIAFLPSREVTADRAVAEWGARPGHAPRTGARADRAGTVRTEVSLD